jgi:hypothetical protein
LWLAALAGIIARRVLRALVHRHRSRANGGGQSIVRGVIGTESGCDGYAVRENIAASRCGSGRLLLKRGVKALRALDLSVRIVVARVRYRQRRSDARHRDDKPNPRRRPAHERSPLLPLTAVRYRLKTTHNDASGWCETLTRLSGTGRSEGLRWVEDVFRVGASTQTYSRALEFVVKPRG